MKPQDVFDTPSFLLMCAPGTSADDARSIDRKGDGCNLQTQLATLTVPRFWLADREAGTLKVLSIGRRTFASIGYDPIGLAVGALIKASGACCCLGSTAQGCPSLR